MGITETPTGLEGLRAWRLEMGYNQRTAADLIGITKEHYCRIECGHVSRVNIATAKRVYDASGVSVPTYLGMYQPSVGNPHD